jgi:enoyl-[acyl-carrier protein] reductase I
MSIQRTALVVGVSNKRSLAWSSAIALLQGQFDHVIVTYQNDRFKSSIEGLVAKQNDFMNNIQATARLPAHVPKLVTCLSCDVSEESEIQSLFHERIPFLLHDRNEQMARISSSSSSSRIKLDALVHSVAFAPSQAMKSSSEFPLLNTTLEEYNTAHSISAHSLLSMSKHALPLLSCSDTHDADCEAFPTGRSPSITALTYLGSARAVRNYNIMGPAKASLEACVRGIAMEISPPPHKIRVNAISAGPVNTLAARGIRDFNGLKHEAEERSFLKRSVTAEEVGSMVEFVAGSRASGVTGQVLFCDGGYSSYGG